MNSQLQTKSSWHGVLNFEESENTIIRIGKLNINSFLHFMSGKRIVLKVNIMGDETHPDESGSITTVGKLEFDPKKKQFTFEKYPFILFLESFEGQKIKMEIELDRSVLSSRMY